MKNAVSDDEYDRMGNIKRKLAPVTPLSSSSSSSSSSSGTFSNGGIRQEILKRVCLLSPLKLVNHGFVSIAAAAAAESGSQEKANGKELNAIISPIELESTQLIVKLNCVVHTQVVAVTII